LQPDPITGRPYATVYSELAEINAHMPLSKQHRNKGAVGSATDRHGIFAKSGLFKDYMTALGMAMATARQTQSRPLPR